MFVRVDGERGVRIKTTFRPGQFICKFEENLLMREQFQVYLQTYINLYYFGCKKCPVCEIAYTTIKCCVCMDDPTFSIRGWSRRFTEHLVATVTYTSSWWRILRVVQMGTRDYLMSVHSVGVL